MMETLVSSPSKPDQAQEVPAQTVKNTAEGDSVPKVFELRIVLFHPMPWMLTELLPALVRAEVPVVVANNVDHLRKICEKWPSSTVVLNMDKQQNLAKIDFVQFVTQHAKLFREKKTTLVYLDRGLTQARQQELKLQGVTTGFIELNQASKNVYQLLYTLCVRMGLATQRKNLRLICEGMPAQPEFNLRHAGQTLRGKIRDLSSVGMACYFIEGEGIHFDQGKSFEDMQIMLKGAPILVSTTVAAIRDLEASKLFVFMFRWGNDMRSKERIYQYIALRLQEEAQALA